MANKKHLAKLDKGMAAWNEWRRVLPRIRPDLRGAKLLDMDLSGANLAATDLAGAVLIHADLRSAVLDGAELTGAMLAAADLSGASFRDASLSWASFGPVKVVGESRGKSWELSSGVSALLRGTDFENAEVGRTFFGDSDLSEAKGLGTVRHRGPSIIGIDTIYRSQGKIPLPFLRGCGVPENFITYMPSLVAPGAIQFYSCFISYSTKDQEFADRLYADLQNKGVRCWFAPHDVQGGKKLHEQIDEAIRRYERLLLILSPNSVSSKWVKTEIRNARKREVAEKKRVLFPVRLASYEALRDWKLFDGDEGEDLATEIREYYIPDFSEWKNHDSYQKEFEKLLRDLRTEGADLSG